MLDALLGAGHSALHPAGRPATLSPLFTALTQACTYSLDLSQGLFVSLFPAAHASLTPTQRARLLPHLSSCLLHTHHQYTHGGTSSTALAPAWRPAPGGWMRRQRL